MGAIEVLTLGRVGVDTTTEIAEAVRAASAAGAIVASRLLWADAMPTADEVEELLDPAGARA